MDIVQAEKIFVQKMQSKNWSIKTIKNYSCQVRLFLQEFKTRDRARNITANEIEEWSLKHLPHFQTFNCKLPTHAKAMGWFPAPLI